MPGFDKTGPNGEGPMTGRGMGPCGKGMRKGFGRGMGCRFGRRAYIEEPLEMTSEQKKKVLEAEAVELEAELNAIKKVIKNEKEKSKE